MTPVLPRWLASVTLLILLSRASRLPFAALGGCCQPRTMASAMRATRRLAATSCTRTRSTPAAMPSAVVASVPSRRWSGGSPSTRPMVDLRLVPSNTGRPSRRRTARSRSRARFWVALLPNPMPGSSTSCASLQPRRRARSTAAPRSAITAVMGCSSSAASDRSCITMMGTPRSAARRARLSAGADPRDIVEQVRPCLKGRLGHRRLGRIDAQGHIRQRRSDRAHDRHDAPQLLVSGHTDVPGARRLTADVEDVGTLCGHLQRLCDGGRDGVGPGGQAVAAEGVRGHVQDADHERAAAPCQLATAQPQAGRPHAGSRVLGVVHQARPDTTDQVERAGHDERAALRACHLECRVQRRVRVRDGLGDLSRRAPRPLRARGPAAPGACPARSWR